MMNLGFFQNCAPTNFSAVNHGTEQMSSTALDQPLDGLCGSSNSLQLMSQPTTNLCSVGTIDAMVTSAAGWSWNCITNNGEVAHCSAINGANTTRVSGSCGTSNGQSYTTQPQTSLCSAGLITNFTTQNSNWTWSCNGSNGGSNAACSAVKLTVINGACGSANNQSVTSQPSTNLCLTGSASALTTSTLGWSWTCQGANTGTNANCSAINANNTIKVSGSCGASNGQSYITQPSTNLCSSGLAATPLAQGSNWSWSCNGSNGGSNALCSAIKLTVINGVCGDTNNQSLSSQPSTNLCLTGTSTNMVASSSGWAWTCQGANTGTSANCSAKNSTLTSPPISGVGTGSGNTVNNNQCGSAQGQSLTTQPISNLCAMGTPTGMTTSSTGWIWNCANNSNSTSVSCSAQKIDVQPVIPDSCQVKLASQFKSAADVGRMMRALYCLFYFRDASLDASDASGIDTSGVSYWSFRYIGGYTVLSKTELVSAIINSATGSDAAAVQTADSILKKTNTLTGGALTLAQAPGQTLGDYAKTLIDTYTSQNPNATFTTNWNSMNPLVDNRLVITIYTAYFNRNPYDNKSDAGPGYWLSRAATPLVQNRDTLLPLYINSNEFFTKATSNGKPVMQLSRDELVSFLYRLAFRRSYDSSPSIDGTYWLSSVDQRGLIGTNSRALYTQLVIDFIKGSNEFCTTTPAACTAINLSTNAITYK